MTTPTKTIVNVQTGEVAIVELSGEELQAYNNALAAQAAQEQTQTETAPVVEGQQ